MTATSIIRGILKELRAVAANSETKMKFSWRVMPAYNEIKAEFENMKDPKQQQNSEKLKSIAMVYLGYLQALRKEGELEEMYKGHGERSIESSAASVGLALPKTYKE